MKFIRLAVVLGIALLLTGWGIATMQVSNREATVNSTYTSAVNQATADAFNGQYVATMGGCIACHTDAENGGMMMAGGLAIDTPFGTFYSPNITSDSSVGIGEWTTEEFLDAMLLGRSPDDQHYYPSFPYTSYSAMTIKDLADLKAWLDSIPPSPAKSPEHELVWPLSIRPALIVWKALYFYPLRITDKTDRGDYLVNGPGHCAECHSPRNILGGIPDRSLTGNFRGPDSGAVPGITATDLSDWTIEDLEFFLEVGITPDGDFTGGHMTDVVEYSTGQLTSEDRTSIAKYLLSTVNTP